MEEFQSSLHRPRDDGGARVVSIFQRRHRVVRAKTGGALSRRLVARVDRDRWSARFSARMAIDHCEGFDSARKWSERFVSIDRIHKCLGGKRICVFFSPELQVSSVRQSYEN